jgi:hypothetical protein
MGGGSGRRAWPMAPGRCGSGDLYCHFVETGHEQLILFTSFHIYDVKVADFKPLTDP